MFIDTSSPFSNMDFVRFLILLGAMNYWALFKLDIKNVFLHGELKRYIYGETTRVCCLGGG